MVLTIHLIVPCRRARDIKRSSYFKVNLALLKNEVNIKKFELAWAEHDLAILDTRRKFAFAYVKVRTKCKEIQGELKPHDRFKIMLQEELQVLTKVLEID